MNQTLEQEFQRQLAEGLSPTEQPKWCPHDPTPKQQLFLDLECEEAFYGGAGGGGKSDALLMAALEYINEPRYAALILRRSFTDLSLPGALMERADEWFGGTPAKWSGASKTWRFPSGGTLTFGYLEHEKDKYRYNSAELQFVGFDELTQFLESQYLYLFSRLRRLAGVQIPLRMRSASNPGGIGHEWVKRRFIIEGEKEGRPFIPAKLGDNPYIDQEAYIRSLMHLDPVMRQRLLDGDWEAAYEGAMFKRHWFDIVDVAPAEMREVRRWDLAATQPKPGEEPDWTAGLRMGMTRAGIYYIADIVRFRGTAQVVEKTIEQTAALDGKAVKIRMEQEPGASGKIVIDDYTRRVLPGYDFKGIPSTGSKEVRAAPFASQAEAGNMKLVLGPWINTFLDELELFPHGTWDDQVDAGSGALDDLQKPRGVGFA